MGNDLRSDINKQNRRIDVIEDRLQHLELGSSVASTAPPGLMQSQADADFLWLSGGSLAKEQAEARQQEFLKFKLPVLDTWITASATKGTFMLFYSFLSQQHRSQFHCMALPIIKTCKQGVWAKM
eukprot:3580878-Amphidinium_carterae.5